MRERDHAVLPAILMGLLLAALITSPAGAVTVSVHGQGDCGAPPNPPASAPVVALPAGTTQVEWLSGAWSLWSSNGQNGGNTWVAHVRARIDATGEVVIIGPGGGFYPTQQAVEAVAVGTVWNLNLATAGTVTFFVNDGGGCGDNRGTVTLEISEPTVSVDPVSWGMIKTYYSVE